MGGGEREKGERDRVSEEREREREVKEFLQLQESEFEVFNLILDAVVRGLGTISRPLFWERLIEAHNTRNRACHFLHTSLRSGANRLPPTPDRFVIMTASKMQ